MQKIYSLNELVGFAVEIEKQGAEFYQQIASRTANKEAGSIFLFLREEELSHQKKYEQLLEEVNQAVNSGGNYSEEYYQYLRALVESVVFKKDDLLQRLVNDNEVIDYAIGKEKDSILFYTEMKNFIPQENRGMVDEIIEEEQLHVIKLLDIKEKVG